MNTARTTSSWAEQARLEEQRHTAAEKARRKRLGRAELAPKTFDLSVITLLCLVAALTHGPVFGGTSGYIAALGGLLIGLVCALTTAGIGMRVIGSILTVVIVYLLAGGALALPSTTMWGIVPTISTIQMLLVGTVTSWKDLLTVQPPAGVFVGPAIMPYLSAYLTTFLAATIVLRTRKPAWAFLPTTLLMFLGIIWGSQSAPLATPLGAVFAALSLAWAGALAARVRRLGSRGTVEFEGQGQRPQLLRRIGAVTMVAAATTIGLIASHTLVGLGHRTVARDYVEPPLDLKEYHSPASQFRVLNTTDKDTELLRVTGLPQGSRVRLATLDIYDGTVVQIAGNATTAGFRNVGQAFTDVPLQAEQETANVSYEILGYAGHWVPGGGTIRALEYTGSRAADLAKTLFYSDSLGTALSTLRLDTGDTYTVTTVVDKQWDDAMLEGRPFMAVDIPANSAVPNAVAEVASTLTAEAQPGIDQVRTLQRKLHDDGFYSDGSDGLSLPGHRGSRIEEFLTGEQLIGDDDQYAVAMALMLHSLGIPARVVMGFYPEQSTGDVLTLTGKDTHLWVEVPFEGAGWVPFDPTPPRDQVPQTEVPQPKPNPRPQVLQPPEPPEEPAELPPDHVEDPDNENEGLPGWVKTLITVLSYVGMGILVLSPLWLLLLIKARRTARRRKKGSADQRTAAAWDDVVDHATDLGINVPAKATRYDQARRIEAQISNEDVTHDSGFHRYCDPSSPVTGMATALDSVVFGQQAANDEHSTQAWQQRNQILISMRQARPWYRRIHATFSTKSLRARRTRLRDRINELLLTRTKHVDTTSDIWRIDDVQPAGKD